MEVELLAATGLMSYWGDGIRPSQLLRMGYTDHGSSVSPIDELHEASGRLCYKSFNRPNPNTAQNPAYLRNILDQQHYSVLEHGVLTIYVAGVSRGLSHEFVRHRHFSYSQVSTRYVDSSEAKAARHPILTDDEWKVVALFQEVATKIYKELFESMTQRGVKLKDARGAARSVLPTATETEFVVTGNVRAWREFIQKRNSPGADAEIRELAQRIYVILRQQAPNSVQDLSSSFQSA